MKRFRLTRKASAEMRQIGEYTSEHWGAQQRSRYLRQLNARFAWIAEHSRLGRRRADINEHYFCFPEGEHLIFYRIDGDTVEIIGVLHKQMDIRIYFGPQ